MYELSVAFKYLIPRWRQLSVSIISLISILVIALVVWLIVVFFSVTHGLEKGWVHKLIALTAPVRIAPTQHYYNSYYYLVDSISLNSDYTLKSIGEKLASPLSDPYNPDFDQEIPIHWPLADLDGKGSLKDPVKLAFEAINSIEIPGLAAKEYEMTVASIKLQLIRKRGSEVAYSGDPDSDQNHSNISQGTYLGSYDPDNPNLAKAMLPVTKEDLQNLIDMAFVDSGFHPEYENDEHSDPEKYAYQQNSSRLKELFDSFSIHALKTADSGLNISKDLLPESCRLKVCALKVGKQVKGLYLPRNEASNEEFKSRTFNERVKAIDAVLSKKEGQAAVILEGNDEIALNDQTPLVLDGGVHVAAAVVRDSLDHARTLRDVQFDVKTRLQDAELSGRINWEQLQIEEFAIDEKGGKVWLFQGWMPAALPSDAVIGDAVLLPKSYRNAGVLIGDRGFLSYQIPTATSFQEQRMPIYVAGFYDPGILPLGGKIILANQYVTAMIRSSYPNDQSSLSNGINVRFDDLDDAEIVKERLQTAFRNAGIEKYWNIETYREFEFTKDFLQQLRSERNLFTLISTIVIIVACANIVSMLIILVTNKKMEIGILRAMGASSRSVALIFGTCGIVMGLVGSLLGLIAAIFTLHNLQGLIDLISLMQGFDAFNPVFYGDSLPNEVSFDALLFVMCATAVTSLIAGVIPAVKASLMRPSAILRSE